MQRVFEGDGLTLTEDGGRVVTPHPMFRIFATANTVGQGDEHGLYQGARPQSMAMLDRFTSWVHVDYLTEKQTDSLVATVVPDLAPNLRERLVKYVQEHIEAFKGSKVLQPISPRGYLDMAEAMVTFMDFLGDEKKASKEAMEMAVLDKASQQDRVVLKGIIDRVFG
jgi:cobaltochelatase CobS